MRKWKKQRDIKEYAQRAARQCGFARVFSWRWGANVGSGTCPDCETFLHIIFNPEREEMDLERFEDYQEK